MQVLAETPLISNALVTTIKKFKRVSGVALAREIFLLENQGNNVNAKEKERRENSIQSQISRHCKGQPAMSTFIENLIIALGKIEPEAKAFYLEQLGSKPKNLDIHAVKMWMKTAEPSEIAEILKLLGERLASVKSGD